MFILGLIAGVGSRMLDFNENTRTLGIIFSQLNIWFLLCVLISIYSPSPKQAMSNVFPFCVNMLIAYYLYDAVTDNSASLRAYLWWSGLAAVTPILGYCSWYSKENGRAAQVLRWSILIISIVANIVMFKDFQYYDIIITATLAYFLFCQKINRDKTRRRYIMKGLHDLSLMDKQVFDELVKQHYTELQDTDINSNK